MDQSARPLPARRGRRNQRRLFFAEQVMERKQQPKKKYLATQRLRRDVERSQAESLALDVNFLKQEIADLEVVREILRANRLAGRVTSVCGLMAVVHEYFGKIQYGVGRETPASAVSLASKVDFLRAVFDENVDFASGRGLDAFIAQCQGYTLFHALFYYETPVLTQVSPKGEEHSIIIVARNRLRVRVSRQTIQVMFPHLLLDEVTVQRLIGSEIVYPCEITVYFDQRGKVVRHDAVVDFVSGLTAALQNLEKVAAVMDSARIKGSAIVYDTSRPHTDAPAKSLKRARPVVEPVSNQVELDASSPYDEDKEASQPQDEPSPTRTPTSNFDEDKSRYYASPPPGHHDLSAINDPGDSLYGQAHASPTAKTAAHPKESVSARMSIHSLLS